MAGISPSLLTDLRATLLSCGPFRQPEELQALFVDKRLYPWRTQIPQANSEAGRLSAVIDTLLERKNKQGENALVLFIQVLSERLDEADFCHEQLTGLAARLDRELTEPGVTEEPQTAPDLFVAYEAGLELLLARVGQAQPIYYEEVRVYQQRLTDNITRVRRQGDKEVTRSERSEILAQLNELTRKALDLPFNELMAQAEAQLTPAEWERPLYPGRRPPQKITPDELAQAIAQAAQEQSPLLDLASRGVTELPPEIGQLTHLQRLDLSDNRLSSLPPEIARLTNLVRLDLRYNPFLPIPPEILHRTGEPQVVINYYLESQARPTASQKALNEVKMILVGQGGVGKTSLVKQLMNEGFDDEESKTEGINVRRWEVVAHGQPVYLNVWDFGGQEIMHATHQFFLTRRSLYLIVLDARKGEQESNLEYWLKLVQSFGEDSPIIVVINKSDEHLLDLNRRGLMEKYPTIKAFVNTSCKTATGIDELRLLVLDEVSAMPHIHFSWLSSWFAVKRRLESTGKDFVSYDWYQEMCEEAGIHGEKDQKTLIAFLHDLGIVLNYRDDPRLEEMNILNPEWVTSAVYKILNNHELFHSKGVLHIARLKEILDRQRYPRRKHDFIVGIMQKFELCFPLDETTTTYLIPDLLPREEPYLNWPPAQDCLLFQYGYQVLPSSVISRFIVRVNSLITQNTYWRTGVVLADGSNQALVKADLEERRVHISVAGQETTRREFLAVLRSHFDHIHRTIPRIEVKAQVPVPGYPNVAVDHAHLLTLERLGQEAFVPSGLSLLFNVKQLLDGIEAGRDKVSAISIEAGRDMILATHSVSTTKLLKLIDDYFSSEELKMLTFYLNIPYEDLSGETKRIKAMELIQYCRRHGLLPVLIDALRSERPHINWDSVYES